MASPDSTATVTVGGEELEIAATNRACMVYAREFKPGAEAPYTGSLVGDIITEFTADTGQRFHSWADLPHVLGAVWAMATAAGSTKQKWPRFLDRVMGSDASVAEVTAATTELFTDGHLGSRTFFRQQAGADAAGEPDAEPSGE
ncbi:hypothetical protein [Collinsella vaginalis]|uniref:hypothetical protein n=1 Tax=Collinsella vaginalis TaxID=1870987 RepID=UPI000A26F435|nr:hypothetical protein [Collinsella vaginalis]